MKKETKEWIEKAKEDLDTANFCFKGKRFEVAIFFSQQAAEKAMKALLLEKTGKIIKTHDLVLLSKKLDAPEKIIEHAKELTLAYTYVRYPGIPRIKNIKKKSRAFLDYAEGVIKWIKESLQS